MNHTSTRLLMALHNHLCELSAEDNQKEIAAIFDDLVQNPDFQEDLLDAVERSGFFVEMKEVVPAQS